MFPRRPERLKEFDYCGPWRYSLTFCTALKHKAFVSHDIVGALTAHLQRTCETEGFELLAYCFMPDHLHLLLEGSRVDSLLKPLCRLLRQRMAHDYAQRTGRRLWQPGYYERVLRREDDVGRCALYILGNPVRAELTNAILEYPLSGGTWFEKLRDESA